MSGEPFTQQSALCCVNGQALLIGNDPLPKRARPTGSGVPRPSMAEP